MLVCNCKILYVMDKIDMKSPLLIDGVSPIGEGKVIVEKYHNTGGLCWQHTSVPGEPESSFESREWWPNGQLRSYCKYEHARRNGHMFYWEPDGRLSSREHYKYGELDGLSECWYGNGQLKWRENYKMGQEDGLCERWDYDGSLCSRRVMSGGADLCWSVLDKLALSNVERKVVLHYQPLRVTDTMWLQLGMDGNVRVFSDDPSHIHDDVYKIAQELAPALRREVEYMCEDPSSYIRIKPKAEAEAEEARMRLGRDDEPKESVSRSIKM